MIQKKIEYKSESWFKTIKKNKTEQFPREGFSLPCEGVDLLGELGQKDVLGGVGENEDDVHVSRPQLHQVAHVGDVRQLRHLHEVLFRRPTTNKKNKKKTKQNTKA